MSTFDNPFDPKRRLNRSGCSCGRHATQGDHERDAQLQCAAVESEDKRYEGVVASAVMRKMFPQDAARRAFLQVGRRLDRARRDLAVLPAQDRDRGVRAGRAAREEGPQGRLHPDHLRHADHHGGADGLL